MKENFKLASFDIDGTLYYYHEEEFLIRETTINALHQLKEKGYKLVISSGRTISDIPKKIDHLFDYYVLCNGGAVYDHNKYLKSYTAIDKTTVSYFVMLCKAEGIHIGLKNKKFMNYFMFDNDIPHYLKNENETNFILNDHYDYMNDDILSIALELDSTKLSVLKKKFPTLEFAHGGYNFYEVYPLEADKKNGLVYVLELESIKREECIAFGDSMNDYKILEYVECGVAMKDGHPELVKNMKETCLPSEQDGIYNYLINKKII